MSQGLLNIVGVQGVEIRGFTVQNSAADGMNGRQGAAFTVHDVSVFHSADDGIEATETSTVRFLGICEVRGSGEDGIAITHGSSALFSAERVTTNENARGGIFVIGTSTAAFDTGTVHTTQNTFGILTLGHSSLTLGRTMPTMLAEDNMLDGILVADTSDLRLDGGTITAARNRRTGLSFGGTGGLGNISGHNFERVQYRGSTSRGCLPHRPADCRAHDHPEQHDGDHRRKWQRRPHYYRGHYHQQWHRPCSDLWLAWHLHWHYYRHDYV